MMSIKSALLFAALVFALIVVGAGCGGGLSADEAARVNGRPITRSVLMDYVSQLAAVDKQADEPTGERASRLQSQALEELITEALLLDESSKRGIHADQAEIEAKMAEIKKQSFDDDETKFSQSIQNQGLTYEEVRERVANGIIMDKLFLQVVGDDADVSDDEIAEYYDANKDSLFEPEKRRLSHILLISEAEAQSAKSRLDSGEDFAALAAEVSIDTNTMSKGGDLGWITRGATSASFDQAAFGLNSGQVSGPVKTPSGFNIIKVQEIKAGGIPPLDEVRDEVRNALVGENGEWVWSNWLTQKLEEADIEYATEFKNLKAKIDSGLPAGHP